MKKKLQPAITLLQQYMARLWRQQHPDHPPPVWPRMPYTTLLPAQLALLSELWPTEEQPT